MLEPKRCKLCKRRVYAINDFGRAYPPNCPHCAANRIETSGAYLEELDGVDRAQLTLPYESNCAMDDVSDVLMGGRRKALSTVPTFNHAMDERWLNSLRVTWYGDNRAEAC